jgi:hypothetical protein
MVGPLIACVFEVVGLVSDHCLEPVQHFLDPPSDIIGNDQGLNVLADRRACLGIDLNLRLFDEVRQPEEYLLLPVETQ